MQLRSLLLAAAVAVSTFTSTQAAWATVEYTLTPRPEARSFDLRIDLDHAREREVFRLPVWTPGFYFLVDFKEKVSLVRATDPDGNPLPIAINGSSWTVSNPLKKPIRFVYRILGDDSGLGFFGAHIDARTAFINGASTFMYPQDRKEEDVRLRVRLPLGWGIATPMESDGADVFRAGGYDEFIDHPIQMGDFVRKTFKIGDVPHEVIWVSTNGTYRPDLDAETERIRLGYTVAPKLFGRTSFRRYMTIIHLAVGNFSGGLEHRASNVQAVSNADVLHLDDLATHEYFHAWNVKQIRPIVLGPFDYTEKVRTDDLWFSEGVTDYYAKMTAYQSGLKGPYWLLGELTSAANEIANSKEATKTTVEGASRLAWENGGFGINDLSYYTKGLLAGLVFDAEIRTRTEGKKSLDDVMRLLYDRHELPKPGFVPDELKKTLIEVGGETLAPLYEDIIRSTKPIDYASLAGIGLRAISPGQPFASPRFQTDPAGIVTATAAKEDPIKMGDQIVRIDREVAAPERAIVTLLRDGKQVKIETMLLITSAADLRIALDPFAGDSARRLGAMWLKGPE